MDNAYEGKVPTKKLAAMVANTSSTRDDTTWYTDSGANTHITSDLANLAIHNEYHGKERVAVGNGAGLDISNTGSNEFQLDSSSFKLKNILHCPSVSANLLSVHQFAVDNHCYFVFYPDCFFVKDLKTGKTLFHGRSEHGLYPFRIRHHLSNKSSRPFAFIGVRTTAPVWHSRLGHPATSTLKHMIANKCFPVTSSSSFSSFCHSCPLGKSTKLPFQLSDSMSNSPLELIHSDVWTSPHILCQILLFIFFIVC